MKAVAPRIERLYESEIERWRAAWDRFMHTFWNHLTYDEQRAYWELTELSERDGALYDEIDAVLMGWHRALGEDEEETGDDTSEAYFDLFWEAVPDFCNKVDLSRWPSGVPWPPDEDASKAQETEAKCQRLCRRDKNKGRAERLAAAYVLFRIAVCRTARIYSKADRER